MNSHSQAKRLATTACLQLADEAATIALGTALAAAFVKLRAHGPKTALCLHLRGDLGAGKSTLARALLRGLGITGKIKSPTYALVEPYDSQYGLLLHMDLYRLTQASELEYLGVDSLISQAALMLIEWPEKGGTLLPAPDLEISLSHCEDAIHLQDDAAQGGRRLQISGLSASGNLLVPKLVSVF